MEYASPKSPSNPLRVDRKPLKSIETKYHTRLPGRLPIKIDVEKKKGVYEKAI
jgi:hypothetical protein